MEKRGNSRNSNRLSRINDEIKKEVSELIRGGLKDPRIGTLTSVTKVETTNDLSNCKIFVSVLGNEKEKEDVLIGLKNAKGFIKNKLASTINLRNTPNLSFALDESLEYSIKISKLLQEAKATMSDDEK